MKHITSPHNSIIKKAMSLKNKKSRDKEGLYLIEGFNLCREALREGADLEAVILRESLLKTEKGKAYKEEFEEIILGDCKPNIEMVSLDDDLFDKLMDTETPQGLGAIVRTRQWNEKDFFKVQSEIGGGNLLVLDRIQDPGNAGTMIRTAEAAGFSGVIVIKGNVDIYSPKVVRSAAGSIFRMAFLFTDTPEKAIDLLNNNNKTIVTATPYCDNYYFEMKLDKNIALVIGNEGGGVSEAFLKEAHCPVKIPMWGEVESLNAAVAASIIMYESTRQNFHKKAEE